MLLKNLLITICVFSFSYGVSAVPPASEKMKPEEVVAKHLASIGSPDSLKAIKSVITVGEATAISRSNAVRNLEGVAQLASDGDKVLFAMIFSNSLNYPYEKAAYDGQKVTVALWQTGQRSALEDFFLSQETIFKQGLIGGILSSAWPLLNLEAKGPKLSYSGTKKINDRLAHELKYTPRKGGGNIQISLFFDAETFRHVRTDYSYTVSARMGDRPQASVQSTATDTGSQTLYHYKLTEEFSDFITTNNLTLPRMYKLRLAVDAQRPLLLDWVISFKQITFNQPIEAAAFNVAASK